MPENEISTFDPLLKVFIKGKPTKPDQECRFYRYYNIRESEWRDFRLLIFSLLIILLVVLIIVFLQIPKEPQIPLIVAFIGLVAGPLGFCGIQWYRHESIFRFIVERCLTLVRRASEGLDTRQYIQETEEKIESGRIS